MKCCQCVFMLDINVLTRHVLLNRKVFQCWPDEMLLKRQSSFLAQNGTSQEICTLLVIFSEETFCKTFCHLGKSLAV